MNCSICKKPTYDHFNNNYIVSFCPDCNLEHASFSIFQNLIKTLLLNKKYDRFTYNYIINLLETDLKKYKFGLMQKSNICFLHYYCPGAIGNECHLYQYNYNGFKFYFCFYQDLIVYNPNDINILITFFEKKAKQYKIQLTFNKFLNFIKNLFIKKEGI